MSGSDDDDELESRAAILKRRALFVASAVAGMALPSCADAPPNVCLSPPWQPPASAASTVEPLGSASASSTVSAEPTASASATASTSASASPSASGLPTAAPTTPPTTTRPQVCLRMAPPPLVCLSIQEAPTKK